MGSTLLQIPCPDCLAPNRVAAERLKDVPVCGRCRAHLLGAHPVALDDARLERYLRASGLPVLVDFWAAWCGPCRAMAPHFERAAQDHVGRVLFAKVDTEAAPRAAARLEIRSIPTLILFQDGVPVARHSGAMGASEIASWLASA